MTTVATSKRAIAGPGLAMAALVALVAGIGGFAAQRMTAPSAGWRVAAQSALPGPAYASPTINWIGEDDLCDSWIGVQNIGPNASVAVLVGVGLSSRPPRGDDGNRPVQVACSGVVRPGSGWSFLGSQVPTGTRAAFVLSVTSRVLDDVGPAGDADLPASALCGRLAARLTRDPAVWPAFWNAWWAGADWEGLPLGRMGGSPLAVEVHRTCPDSVTPGIDTNAAARAVRLAPPVAGGYAARLDGLAGQRRAPRETPLLYLLNTGVVTGTFTLRLQDDGACAADAVLASAAVAPGAVWPVAIASGAQGRWTGSAILAGDGPFVAGYDEVAGSRLTSGTVIALGGGEPPPGGDALAAPLLLDPGDNVVDLVVRNDGPAATTSHLDLFGAAGSADLGEICSGGVVTRTLAIPAPGAVPLPLLAVVRGAAASDALSAVVRVRHLGARYGGAAYDVMLARQAAAPPADAASMAVVALPVAANDLINSGLLTDIAIGRFGGGDGALDVVLTAYNANALVERQCLTIAPGTRAVRVSVGEAPGFRSGLNGHLTISAGEWRPQAPGAAPGELIALNLIRKGSVALEDVPGDELGATLGEPIGGADAAALRAEALAGSCGPAPEPAPSGAGSRTADATAYVPMVSYEGTDDVCGSKVRVTNIGSTATQFLVIAFDEPGYCEPKCTGPLDIACSPLIAPGERWFWPGLAMSAMIVSLRPESLDSLGIRPGDSRSAAERLCASAVLVDDCDVWRRFNAAWTEGGTFDGLPMDQLVGAPIAVSVGRTCPDAVTAGISNMAVYTAPTGRDVAAGRTQPERWVYTIGEVWASTRGGDDSRNTILYIQNAGLRCATVNLTFIDRERRSTQCHVRTISPGESYAMDANDCVGPDFTGSLVLASTEPMAVVADRLWPWLTNARSIPGGEPCDVDADGDIGMDDWLAVRAALGSVEGAPNWNPRSDLDSNGWIDAADLDLVAACLAPGARTPTPDGAPTPATRPTATPWNGTPQGGTPGVDATATGSASATAQATGAAGTTSTPPRMTHWAYLPIAFTARR